MRGESWRGPARPIKRMRGALWATPQPCLIGRTTPEELEADFRAEMADVLCQLLLMANHHGVDIEAEVDRKWLYRLGR
jgi:hypothetical protein